MQFIIQQFLFPQHNKATQRARAHRCNYPDNYYGDQICLPTVANPNKNKHLAG